jgi:adenosylmethionine-8-amino-7-oxononanoate aminotransferase
MHFYSPEILGLLRSACDEHGLLLILDEIATGFGRTGRLFACEHAGVAPDVMCVGKALTGGYLSLAATLCTSEVARAISDGAGGALMHGPTFMGNALACAVASASIDLLADGSWRDDVRRIECGLAAGLEPARALPGVPGLAGLRLPTPRSEDHNRNRRPRRQPQSGSTGIRWFCRSADRDVRVLGAIGVVQLDTPVDIASATQAATDAGVWLRPFRDLVYAMPPYVTGDDDVARIAHAMVAAAACRPAA